MQETQANSTTLKYQVSVIIEGKPNQLCAQGMRLFEQYDEICKYFSKGKQKDNNAKEFQKPLQLLDLRVGEYLTDKYIYIYIYIYIIYMAHFQNNRQKHLTRDG